MTTLYILQLNKILLQNRAQVLSQVLLSWTYKQTLQSQNQEGQILNQNEFLNRALWKTMRVFFHCNMSGYKDTFQTKKQKMPAVTTQLKKITIKLHTASRLRWIITTNDYWNTSIFQLDLPFFNYFSWTILEKRWHRCSCFNLYGEPNTVQNKKSYQRRHLFGPYFT